MHYHTTTFRTQPCHNLARSLRVRLGVASWESNWTYSMYSGALCCLCKRYSDVRKPQQAHINYADHSCCPSGWTNLSGRISCYSVSPWETMEHKSPTSLASPPVSVGMINRLSWNIKKTISMFFPCNGCHLYLLFFLSPSLFFSSPQPNWWIDHSFSHSS